MTEKAYIEIAKLRKGIEVRKRKINQLREKAIKELREEGLTYDKIVKILDMGKSTIIKIDKKERDK